MEDEGFRKFRYTMQTVVNSGVELGANAAILALFHTAISLKSIPFGTVLIFETMAGVTVNNWLNEVLTKTKQDLEVKKARLLLGYGLLATGLVYEVVNNLQIPTPAAAMAVASVAALGAIGVYSESHPPADFR